ncbi:MAG: CIC family chloride channel protein [Alteromonadaceae bacterium]|jgi:CIC family chloride channel protein
MFSLNSFRKQLALPITSWQLCLLGMIGGFASALLIILFTLSIEAIQQLYLVKKDNYNSLDQVSRFDLPIIGALIILLFAWLTGYKYLRTGIPLVLHRLKVANGVMPLKNTLNQFWGSAIALATGFSVGREGPAVHLGAASSTYIGNILKLPHNSMRTLCGCGVAAAIAASFNTPIAAVIFVMEVILREYKIHMFIPIMLSAMIGSIMTRSVFGPVHEFEHFSQITMNYQHYPWLIVAGLFLGFIAFLFNRYLVLITKFSEKYHIISRLMLAAFITGGLGYFIPFAMGTGLSAIDFSINHPYEFQLLFALLIAKLVMTVFALGLGIPGGIIGPILGIGSIAGAGIAAIVILFVPDANLSSDFILMGMAGFMAATLNAPLAALLAIVELSNQIEIVVPAMIVIAVACVTSGQFFKSKSIFVMQANILGLTYRQTPIEKSLQKVGVIGFLNENITLIENDLTANEQYIKSAFIAAKPDHPIIIKNTDGNSHYQLITGPVILNNEQSLESLQLIKHQLFPLSSQATLSEAYNALVAHRVGGVYIYDIDPKDILGIITFEQIRAYLVEGKFS